MVAIKPAIYMSMGPSGAGKDTLLLGARNVLVAAGDMSIDFVPRHVTRAAEKCTEIEVPVTYEVFAEQEAAGMYSLKWDAHATRYAVPKSELEAGLEQGRRLVLNVSRSIIPEVLKEYGEKRGVEVYCLNITASEKVLRERLGARGRESEEEVNSRIRRAKEMEPKGPHVINIVNEGPVEDGVQAVLNALRCGPGAMETA